MQIILEEFLNIPTFPPFTIGETGFFEVPLLSVVFSVLLFLLKILLNAKGIANPVDPVPPSSEFECERLLYN